MEWWFITTILVVYYHHIWWFIASILVVYYHHIWWFIATKSACIVWLPIPIPFRSQISQYTEKVSKRNIIYILTLLPSPYIMAYFEAPPEKGL